MKRFLAAISLLATLVIVPYIIGLLNSATDQYLTNNNISYNRLFVFIIISLMVVSVVSFVIYMCFSIFSKRVSITKLTGIVLASSYNGAPLFEIPGEETVQFGMLIRKKSTRIYLALMRLFGLYPVIYYNVTAKKFLNWIDYLYLKLLNDLNVRCNAKIIISLHIDEPLLNAGIYDEKAKEQYLQLKNRASEIIKKVVPKAQIKDEYSYYLKAKNSMDDHPEYFIGTIISNINFYIQEIVKGSMDYKKFIRKESNILSVMPISVLSRKYRHLFVLDYIGSFDIWKLQPYRLLKQQNNILFIGCNTIKDKNGDRIPSWSETDGVNFTDTAEQIGEKIRKTDRAINSALYEIYTGNSASSLDDKALQDICITTVLQIKSSIGL